VIEDNIGNISPHLVLTHEAGLYLGLTDLKGSQHLRQLMYEKAAGHFKLTWEEIKKVQQKFG
jgi:hypothetical protein